MPTSRPATETICEHVLQHARREDTPPLRRIADVCTGTGCVALALAKNLPDAALVATDLSGDALDLARENAEALGLADRVEFREGDLLAPLAGERFDLIVSNPPYIPDDEWGAVEPNVKDHEPTLALRGGADGLDLVRPLFEGAADLLEPDAWLAVEVATSRAELTASIAADLNWRDIDILDDHEGLPRVVVAHRP